MALKSGHTIEYLTGEEAEKQKDFKGYTEGTIRLQPDQWFYSSRFIKYADRYYDFEFRPTDVVIMTYAKCGTTWTQEIIWTLLKNPDLDNPAAEDLLYYRSPFLEADFIFDACPYEAGDKSYDDFVKKYPDRDPTDGIMLQLAEVAEDPRVIKTHLPFSLLSPKLIDTCKVIYVVRDPKDVAVSFLHHSRLLNVHHYVGSNEDFINHFLNDTLMFSPFWTHIKEAWLLRNHPNVHFCYYEDMKADPKDQILQFKNFLGIERSDEQIDKVLEYTSFPAMKAREQAMIVGKSDTPSLNEAESMGKFMNVDIAAKDGGFIRKGICGDWKNKLSMDQAKKIQEWTLQNTKDFGPEFKYGK